MLLHKHPATLILIIFELNAQAGVMCKNVSSFEKLYSLSLHTPSKI